MYKLLRLWLQVHAQDTLAEWNSHGWRYPRGRTATCRKYCCWSGLQGLDVCWNQSLSPHQSYQRWSLTGPQRWLLQTGRHSTQNSYLQLWLDLCCTIWKSVSDSQARKEYHLVTRKERWHNRLIDAVFCLQWNTSMFWLGQFGHLGSTQVCQFHH